MEDSRPSRHHHNRQRKTMFKFNFLLRVCEFICRLELNKAKIKTRKNTSSLFGHSVLAAWPTIISILVWILTKKLNFGYYKNFSDSSSSGGSSTDNSFGDSSNGGRKYQVHFSRSGPVWSGAGPEGEKEPFQTTCFESDMTLTFLIKKKLWRDDFNS